MRFISSIIILLSLTSSMEVYGQKSFTLDDLIPGGKSYAKLAKKRSARLSQMRWYGDDLTYVEDEEIKQISEKGKKKTIISFDKIYDKLGITDEIETILSMHRPISSVLLRTKDKNQYLFNLATKRVDAAYELEDAENTDFCEHNKMLAYTRKNNLYLQTKEGEEYAITNERDGDIVHGQSVHQREFGISKGTFWSPKGNYIAFYRMDESMVTDYPLVDVTQRVAKLKSIKYPMAGMDSHHVTLGVYDINTGITRYLDTGEVAEKYLTNITWSPDEKLVYIAELNRGQDTCTVKAYDIDSGELHKTLFTETHTKYVEPQNPLLFLENDESKFIWQSRRDGYNHAYLYNTGGEELLQITAGSWELSAVLGVDEDESNLIYLSSEESPIEQHIYKIALVEDSKGERAKMKLSGVHGVHTSDLSPSGKYLYDAYSSQKNPGELAYLDLKSNKSEIIHKAKDPYKDYKIPEISIGTIKTDDGKTDLYYRLIKPVNFDSKKQYPTLIYVYGGPHSQLVTDTWLGQASGWQIYMAQLGYVVFTMDNRGTSNRGFDFENIIHRQLGVVETIDQMSGIDFLRTLAYVDQKRIGIHGWSYGGFMTLNLMTRYPDVFKAGVAGGPATDWSFYEIMYGERYMDHPEENPEGYKQTSMLNRIEHLNGRLLIIHGDIDPVVVPQHTMQLLKSSVEHKKQLDLYLYTGHGHNVLGGDRVHLHEKITRYFEDFLRY